MFQEQKRILRAVVTKTGPSLMGRKWLEKLRLNWSENKQLQFDGEQGQTSGASLMMEYKDLFPSPKERILHLGPFVCLLVCYLGKKNFFPKYVGLSRLSVCLSVCLAAQNFHVFLRNRLSDREEFFTFGANTHVECYNDNYDVILLRIWKPFTYKQTAVPKLSYVDKYVFIVRVPYLCLMGITCVRCELLFNLRHRRWTEVTVFTPV